VLQAAGASAAAGLLLPGHASFAAAAQATPEPVSGGTLTFGYAKPAENIINPLHTIGTGQNVLIEAMFLRLVYGRQWGDGMNPQEEGDLELAVAEEMTEIEPDRVWEFKLRENVLWHDGEPVTADDVIFGIWLSLNKNAGASNETPVVGIKGGERLQNEGAEVGDISVEGATKIDDYNLRIELDRPIANYWKSWYVGYWPMPVHIFGEMPFDQLFAEPYATKPVGNGPFKALNYVDGQYMEMEANEDFYLGRPLLDKFIVRFGDGDTLSAALEAQEIDGTTVAPGQVYDRLSQLPYIVGNPVPSTHPNGLVANVGRLGDQAAGLNKAIMHAVDVETINSQLYSGTLRPSNNLFEHVPGYETPPEGFVTYEYDTAKAQAVLQEIGWDSNKELEWLIIGTPGTLHDAIQAMLTAVGIRTRYNPIDPATAIDNLYVESNFDIVMSNFGPYEFFEYDWKYFKCGWTYDTGGFNYAQYCNEEVDSLFEQGLAETDPDAAKALFDEAILLLNQEPPQATLYRGSTVYVWNSRVQGAYPYQYRIPVRLPFERVWIQPQ
jgi:peptide/nickel transport system substrate-binding protein